MDWKEFIGEIKELSGKIDYSPDIIIGINRGGVIPARLLSTYLDVKNMHCVSVYKKDDVREVMTKFTYLFGKSVLLVEDMPETGGSLAVVKGYLESLGFEVKTACLYIMPISEFEPDFYLREVQDVVEFPWEIKDLDL